LVEKKIRQKQYSSIKNSVVCAEIWHFLPTNLYIDHLVKCRSLLTILYRQGDISGKNCIREIAS